MRFQALSLRSLLVSERLPMEVGIILVYFSLFNTNYIALEAGEVEVPLNYVSSYFRTFSPHRNVR